MDKKTASDKQPNTLASTNHNNASPPKKNDSGQEQYFAGEDQSLAGKRLYVDLVPFTARFTSLRGAVTTESWKKISEMVKTRSGRKCEICNATESGLSKKLEVHSRWRFSLSRDPTKTKVGIQTLNRLLCLCHTCFEVANFDTVRETPGEQTAVLYLATKNRWPRSAAIKHINEAFVTRDFMSRVPAFVMDYGIFRESAWFIRK